MIDLKETTDVKKPAIKYSLAFVLGLLFAMSFGEVSAGGAAPEANIPRALPAPTPAAKPADIEQQKKPALKPATSNNALKLTIKTFEFTGNPSFSDEKLNALLSDYQHREIGLSELNQAIVEITQFYRQKGFFLAQAYLPEQDIKGGVVEIAVLEGELNTFSTNSNSDLDQSFLQEMGRYRLGKGDTVTESNLVRNVTQLNSLPGINATAQLSPGEAVGTTNVNVDFLPLPRWQGYVSANTFGNRFTGREVANVGLMLNNAIGLGDQFSVNLKRSNNEGQRGVQLAFYTPVHASGTLMNVSYNYVDYKLGGAFEQLDAFGDSQYFNFGIDQPIFRDAQKSLTARFNLVQQKINDEVATVGLENRRNVTGLDLGLVGDWLNDAGNVSYQLAFNVRAGEVKFKNDVAQSLDETGASTKGGFAKYGLHATRIQYFSNGVSLALQADYQRASKNLDSVEKMPIGGINRWRPFSELPSLADTGVVVGAELRKQILANQVAHLISITPYGFIDIGRGKLNQKPLTGNNHVKSIHGGLGIDAAFKNNWTLSIVGSHHNRDFAGSGAENEMRFWGQLVKYF